MRFEITMSNTSETTRILSGLYKVTKTLGLHDGRTDLRDVLKDVEHDDMKEFPGGSVQWNADDNHLILNVEPEAIFTLGTAILRAADTFGDGIGAILRLSRMGIGSLKGIIGDLKAEWNKKFGRPNKWIVVSADDPEFGWGTAILKNNGYGEFTETHVHDGKRNDRYDLRFYDARWESLAEKQGVEFDNFDDAKAEADRLFDEMAEAHATHYIVINHCDNGHYVAHVERDYMGLFTILRCHSTDSRIMMDSDDVAEIINNNIDPAHVYEIPAGNAEAELDRVWNAIPKDLNWVEGQNARTFDMQQPDNKNEEKYDKSAVGKVCGTARVADFGEGKYAILDKLTSSYSYVVIVKMDGSKSRTITENMSGDLNAARADIMMRLLDIDAIFNDCNATFASTHKEADVEFNNRVMKMIQMQNQF